MHWRAFSTLLGPSAKLFSFTCDPLQLQRKITSLEEPLEPRKKLVSHPGLHVTPMRDFCPPIRLLSSSGTLASETFDSWTFHLLQEEMEQQQGS